MVAVRSIQDLPPKDRLPILQELIVQTNPLTNQERFEDLFVAYLRALVESRDG